ncbi:MAG: class I SAM-dependent methyltransferase [Sedimentisphaerales bacterium]|nr:class I SAM-dependent methyltransferase [Sedimentisphaerales bacterium]
MGINLSAMIKFLSHIIPEPYKTPLERWYRKIRYFGTSHYCPVCNSHVRGFKPYTKHNVTIEEVLCPVCGLYERHRFVWIYLRNHTTLIDGSEKSMLHIAPEKEFQKRLKKLPRLNYLSADLDNPNAMQKMDITNIPCPDHSFDVIYCCHVLEHVTNDRQAITEFFRVLKPQGWMVILVPVLAEKTIEEPTTSDTQTRLRLFGQENHVRMYGPDIIHRLEDSGFRVNVVNATDILSTAEIIRFGVKNEQLFFCSKYSR